MRFYILFKDVAVYGLGDILVKGIAFFTMPIYTRLFTPEEYGIWNFVITAAGLLAGILILGGDSAYARFFFEAKTLREQQVITSTWFSFLALWSSGIVILCLPLVGEISRWSFGTGQYGPLFIMVLLAAPLTLINTMCGQVLRNQFQAKLFTMLNALTTLLTIGLSLYGVIGLNLGLTGVIGGALVATALMLPIRLWTAKSMLRPLFSAQVLRALLAYGTPLVPVSLAYWIFGVSDRLVLGKLASFDQVGLYVVANTVAAMLGLLNGALGQAWSPYMVRLYEEQPALAPVFFGQVMTYILVGFGLLCVGLATFAYELLFLLSTPDFYPAALAIGPLALGFMAYASTQITAAGIGLTKQTKYYAIFSWLAALLNLALNLLFVPNWGMIAASWSTAIAYIFLTGAYLMTSQRLWPVVYEKRRSLLVIGFTLCFVIMAPWLPPLSLALSFVIKGTYCLIYVALLLVFQVLDQREWQALVRTAHALQTRWVEKTA